MEDELTKRPDESDLAEGGLTVFQCPKCGQSSGQSVPSEQKGIGIVFAKCARCQGLEQMQMQPRGRPLTEMMPVRCSACGRRGISEWKDKICWTLGTLAPGEPACEGVFK